MHHPQDEDSDPTFARDFVEEVALAAVAVSGPDKRLEASAPYLWEGWRSTMTTCGRSNTSTSWPNSKPTAPQPAGVAW